jgi:diacylglycerol kinase family enzyme
MRMDLGVLGSGNVFAINAGMGVDSEMVAAAPLRMRRRFGVLAYFATAAQSMLRMKPFRVRATVDGAVVERDSCISAMVVNMGSIFGGLFELGPGISHDDGMIDLCLYSARNLAGTALLSGRLAFRNFSDPSRMTFARGRHITLETVPARECQADGELIGMSPIVARVEPRAALLLVPRRGG